MYIPRCRHNKHSVNGNWTKFKIKIFAPYFDENNYCVDVGWFSRSWTQRDMYIRNSYNKTTTTTTTTICQGKNLQRKFLFIHEWSLSLKEQPAKLRVTQLKSLHTHTQTQHTNTSQTSRQPPTHLTHHRLSHTLYVGCSLAQCRKGLKENSRAMLD